MNDSIETAIQRGEINLALKKIHDLVESVIAEPIFTALLFGSYELDQWCLAIGQKNLANLPSFHRDVAANFDKTETVIFLVSRLQRSGGHLRLVQDMIRAQPEKNHLVISTELGGSSDKNFLLKLFAPEKNVRFRYSPSGNFEFRLSWLQSTLLGINIEHLYLLNHHQDSVAVSALVPDLGLKGTFIHHGDHHLCLGVCLKHLTHVDLHPMGFYHCRDELGLNNHYLPLTFEDKQSEPSATEFKLGGAITTATAARYNKVEIPYHVSYLDAIALILKATGGRHIHIGKLTPWGLNRIYKQMRKHGLSKNRFIYIDWTPSVWKTLQAYSVDVYIASFPYGGGLTLIEAQGAGIPIITHRHVHSRVLSGLELAYPEAFSWSYIEELLNHLAELTPSQLEIESGLARHHYETYHGSEILEEYLNSSHSWCLVPGPLVKTFKPRWIDWALCIQMQQSITQLVYRRIYRFLRKISYLIQ